jgi:hypothetical protein
VSGSKKTIRAALEATIRMPHHHSREPSKRPRAKIFALGSKLTAGRSFSRGAMRCARGSDQQQIQQEYIKTRVMPQSSWTSTLDGNERERRE